MLTPGGPSGLQMVVATAIAFVVGYAAIAWLLRYIEHHSVYLFVWYRLALGPCCSPRSARDGSPRPELSPHATGRT